MLFKSKRVVTCGLQILPAHLVNATQVEVRKRIRIITRSKQSAFKPANAAVSVAFGQKVTTDVVGRIPQGCVDTDCR